jgi:hypothetical protein
MKWVHLTVCETHAVLNAFSRIEELGIEDKLIDEAVEILELGLATTRELEVPP